MSETTPEAATIDAATAALDLGIPDKTPKDNATPRTGRTRAPRATSTPRATAPRRATKVDIAGGMANIYTSAAVALSIVPSKPAEGSSYTATQQVAAVIMENAEACGKAWESLAKDNAAVRQALERMLAVSAIGALIAAHTPIIIAAVIAAGVVPSGMGAILAAVAQPTPAARSTETA